MILGVCHTPKIHQRPETDHGTNRLSKAELASWPLMTGKKVSQPECPPYISIHPQTADFELNSETDLSRCFFIHRSSENARVSFPTYWGQLLIKENCPTISQTATKPRAITEFKLSIDMDHFPYGL